MASGRLPPSPSAARARCRYCASRGYTTTWTGRAEKVPCEHPPFRVNDIVFIRGAVGPQDHPLLALRGVPLRVTGLDRDGHGWTIGVITLDDARPSPEGMWDASWFVRTLWLSFALDRSAVDALRELRRLRRAAHAFQPDAWAAPPRALPKLLLQGLRTTVDLWEDDPADWTDGIRANLEDWRKIAPTGRVVRLRARVGEPFAKRLIEVAATIGVSVDELACASIAESLAIVCFDGAPEEAMRPELRLAALPPEAAKEAADPGTDEGGEGRVSIDVLEEVRAEATAAPPAPPPASPTAPAEPEKPKVPQPGATPEQVLAFRPLKPPGRAA